VDDLARGAGDILAQLEGAGIRVGELAFFEVGGEPLDTADEIGAVRFERALQDYRIR
jgi:hypothetical protein